MLTDIFYHPKYTPGGIWHYAQKSIAGSGHNAQGQRIATPNKQIVQKAQYTADQIVQNRERTKKPKKNKKRACNLKNICYNRKCQGEHPTANPQKKFFKNLQESS